jgi:hypothetical protein
MGWMPLPHFSDPRLRRIMARPRTRKEGRFVGVAEKTLGVPVLAAQQRLAEILAFNSSESSVGRDYHGETSSIGDA